MKKYMKSLATVAALMLLPLSVRSEWFFTDLNKKMLKTSENWLFFTVFCYFKAQSIKYFLQLQGVSCQIRYKKTMAFCF